MNQLHQIGPNIWTVNGLFRLGHNQTSGLQYEGLRDRLVEKLGQDPLNHQTLQNTASQESTESELLEEKKNVERILKKEYVDFPLDTHMTIVRDGENITLISVVAFDDELFSLVKALGTVQTIICPNLQHWLFVPSALQYFPGCTVYVPPAALGEDVAVKLRREGDINCVPFSEATLNNGGEIILGTLQVRLLQGAPFALNEVLFFHEESNTLIATDSFYGGYTKNDTPSWFSRLWFKLTKQGSFQACRLPIYRTCRVLSHGDPEKLLDCIDKINASWNYDQIVFAHGTSPFTFSQISERLIPNEESFRNVDLKNIGDLYKSCWKVGLENQ